MDSGEGTLQARLYQEDLELLRSSINDGDWQSLATYTEILETGEEKLHTLYGSGHNYALLMRTYGKGGVRQGAPLIAQPIAEFGSAVDIIKNYPKVWEAHLIDLETKTLIEKTIEDAKKRGEEPVVNPSKLRGQARQILEAQAYKPEQ